MSETVTDIFSGTITTRLQWSRVDTQEVGSVTNKKIAQSVYNLDDGSGEAEANIVFADTRTIAANGIDAINCRALTQQTLGVDVPFVFSGLRVIRISNLDETGGKYVYVGASETDPFNVFACAVASGSEMLAINHNDSWAVNDANGTFYIANPNAAPITYAITLIGA